MKKFIITFTQAVCLMSLMVLSLAYGANQNQLQGHAICIGVFTLAFIRFYHLSKQF